MGDQLAKGWADSKALESPQRGCFSHAYSEEPKESYEAQQRRLMREYLAAEAAEEATLP